MPILDRLTSGIMTAKRLQAVAGRGGASIGVPGDSGERNVMLVDHSARVCGAAGCTSGWMKPWKNRSRPVFEEEWGCSSRCLGTMVAAAVRREMGGASEDGDASPHRHRVPLGLVLLAQGWITHPQLQQALASQREAGNGRIGSWLARTAGLQEDRITRGLGVQWNCPVLNLEGFSPRAMALVMPKRFVAEFGLVPLRIAGQSILYLAFQETSQPAAALALEQMGGFKVESGLLAATQMEQARKKLLEAESVPVRIRLMPDRDSLSEAVLKLLEQRQPVASRLVRMHQYYWMRMWMEEGALTSRGSVPRSVEDMEDHIFMIS